MLSQLPAQVCRRLSSHALLRDDPRATGGVERDDVDDRRPALPRREPRTGLSHRCMQSHHALARTAWSWRVLRAWEERAQTSLIVGQTSA